MGTRGTPPHLVLLPYELGEFTVAPGRLLRQTRARPLDQDEVILVDGGRRNLGRALLVSNKRDPPGLYLERPSPTTASPTASALFLLPQGEKITKLISSQSGRICNCFPQI